MDFVKVFTNIVIVFTKRGIHGAVE